MTWDLSFVATKKENVDFWRILKLKYKNIFHKFPSFPSAFILYAQIEWVQNSYTPFKVNLK